MNWLLVLVLVILIVNIYHGYKKGLLKYAISIVALLAVVIFAIVATPYATDWFKANTSLEETITVKLIDNKDNVKSEDEAENLGLEILKKTGIYDKLAGKVSEIALVGISFVCMLILGALIYLILKRLLGLIDKVPIIGFLNKSAGAAVGLLKGCIIVWVAFSITALNSSTTFGMMITSYIYESEFLTAMYENNVILSTLLSVL